MSDTPDNGRSVFLPDENKIINDYFSGGEKFSVVKKEVVDGKKVLSAREKLGEELLRLHEADMLTFVKCPAWQNAVDEGVGMPGVLGQPVEGKHFPPVARERRAVLPNLHRVPLPIPDLSTPQPLIYAYPGNFHQPPPFFDTDPITGVVTVNIMDGSDVFRNQLLYDSVQEQHQTGDFSQVDHSKMMDWVETVRVAGSDDSSPRGGEFRETRKRRRNSSDICVDRLRGEKGRRCLSVESVFQPPKKSKTKRRSRSTSRSCQGKRNERREVYSSRRRRIRSSEKKDFKSRVKKGEKCWSKYDDKRSYESSSQRKRREEYSHNRKLGYEKSSYYYRRSEEMSNRKRPTEESRRREERSEESSCTKRKSIDSVYGRRLSKEATYRKKIMRESSSYGRSRLMNFKDTTSYNKHSGGSSRSDSYSYRDRKIIMVSPVRGSRTSHDIFNDQKRSRKLGDRCSADIKYKVKTSVKDRLGVRKEDKQGVRKEDKQGVRKEDKQGVRKEDKQERYTKPHFKSRSDEFYENSNGRIESRRRSVKEVHCHPNETQASISDDSARVVSESEIIAVLPISPPGSKVKCSGRVKTFLNEDFGIIEFSEANATPAKCLFDTYNVYLKGGKTAAESKLTVGNVLALDMKVCFHACEISPGSSVPWLATAVWRSDTPPPHPKPLHHSRISQAKLDVFNAVVKSSSGLGTPKLQFTKSVVQNPNDTEDKIQEIKQLTDATEVLDGEVAIAIDSDLSPNSINSNVESVTLVVQEEDHEEMTHISSSKEIIDTIDAEKLETKIEKENMIDSLKMITFEDESHFSMSECSKSTQGSEKISIDKSIDVGILISDQTGHEDMVENIESTEVKIAEEDQMDTGKKLNELERYLMQRQVQVKIERLEKEIIKEKFLQYKQRLVQAERIKKIGCDRNGNRMSKTLELKPIVRIVIAVDNEGVESIVDIQEHAAVYVNIVNDEAAEEIVELSAKKVVEKIQTEMRLVRVKLERLDKKIVDQQYKKWLDSRMMRKLKFNELGSEMVLLHEVKNYTTNSEFEGASVYQQSGELNLGKSLFAPSQFLTTITTLVDGTSAAVKLDKEGGDQVEKASARGNIQGGELFGVRRGQVGIGIGQSEQRVVQPRLEGGQAREGLGQAADLVVYRSVDSQCETDSSQARDNKCQGERRSRRAKIPTRRNV